MAERWRLGKEGGRVDDVEVEVELGSVQVEGCCQSVSAGVALGGVSCEAGVGAGIGRGRIGKVSGWQQWGRLAARLMDALRARACRSFWP